MTFFSQISIKHRHFRNHLSAFSHWRPSETSCIFNSWNTHTHCSDSQDFFKTMCLADALETFTPFGKSSHRCWQDDDMNLWLSYLVLQPPFSRRSYFQADWQKKVSCSQGNICPVSGGRDWEREHKLQLLSLIAVQDIVAVLGNVGTNVRRELYLSH